MPQDIMQELFSAAVQSSGAAAVALIAFYYWSKLQASFISLINSFNKTIQTHLKENAKSLQKLSDTNNDLRDEFSATNRELREVLQGMYLHNQTLYQENKKHKSNHEA